MDIWSSNGGMILFYFSSTNFIFISHWVYWSFYSIFKIWFGPSIIYFCFLCVVTFKALLLFVSFKEIGDNYGSDREILVP